MTRYALLGWTVVALLALGLIAIFLGVAVDVVR